MFVRTCKYVQTAGNAATGTACRQSVMGERNGVKLPHRSIAEVDVNITSFWIQNVCVCVNS
jgi:hypothetical protein